MGSWRTVGFTTYVVMFYDFRASSVLVLHRHLTQLYLLSLTRSDEEHMCDTRPMRLI